MQHADDHTNDKGEIVIEAAADAAGPAGTGTPESRGVQWGIWVNVQRNPRTKSVAFPRLGLVVEVPKSVALASLALRVQVRTVHVSAAQVAWGCGGSAGRCGAHLAGALSAAQTALLPLRHAPTTCSAARWTPTMKPAPTASWQWGACYSWTCWHCRRQPNALAAGPCAW